MKDNFYSDLLKRIENIEQKLLDCLLKRELIIRDRGTNEYQVHWKDSLNSECSKIVVEFGSLLEDYQRFQNGIGEKVIDELSRSKERAVKSILNLLTKDVWFDSNVYSRFRRDSNNYYRTYKGDIQKNIFIENETDETAAKQMMINQCRKELEQAFKDKLDYSKNHLKLKAEKLVSLENAISHSSGKPELFYNFGLKIKDTNPTEAMVLLGVSIECQLKSKYNSIIQENLALGKMIGELQRKKKLRNRINLLKDINIKYNKAKHEKNTLMTVMEVTSLYQQSIFLFA